MSKNILHLFNVSSELFDILRSLENVLTVEVSELDFRNIICLNFVDTEADHKVRYNLALLLG